MQALVIYDSTGNVWNITYGDSALPGNLSSAQMEIPDGTQLTGVDLTDPSDPQPVFKPLPQSGYDELQAQMKELKEQLAKQQEENLALAGELTNTQLALTEIYEGMGV